METVPMLERSCVKMRYMGADGLPIGGLMAVKGRIVLKVGGVRRSCAKGNEMALDSGGDLHALFERGVRCFGA